MYLEQAISDISLCRQVVPCAYGLSICEWCCHSFPIWKRKQEEGGRKTKEGGSQSCSVNDAAGKQSSSSRAQPPWHDVTLLLFDLEIHPLWEWEMDLTLKYFEPVWSTLYIHTLDSPRPLLERANETCQVHKRPFSRLSPRLHIHTQFSFQCSMYLYFIPGAIWNEILRTNPRLLLVCWPALNSQKGGPEVMATRPPVISPSTHHLVYLHLIMSIYDPMLSSPRFKPSS